MFFSYLHLFNLMGSDALHRGDRCAGVYSTLELCNVSRKKMISAILNTHYSQYHSNNTASKGHSTIQFLCRDKKKKRSLGFGNDSVGIELYNTDFSYET